MLDLFSITKAEMGKFENSEAYPLEQGIKMIRQHSFAIHWS